MNKETSINNYINQKLNNNIELINKFNSWKQITGVDKWINCSNNNDSALKIINAKHIKNKLQSLPEHTDHINIFKNSKTKTIYLTYQIFYDLDFILNEVNEWNMNNIYNIQVYEPNYAWQGDNYYLVVISLHN